MQTPHVGKNPNPFVSSYPNVAQMSVEMTVIQAKAAMNAKYIRRAENKQLFFNVYCRGSISFKSSFAGKQYYYYSLARKRNCKFVGMMMMIITLLRAESCCNRYY